jgi:hypothetical protein
MYMLCLDVIINGDGKYMKLCVYLDPTFTTHRLHPTGISNRLHRGCMAMTTVHYAAATRKSLMDLAPTRSVSSAASEN